MLKQPAHTGFITDTETNVFIISDALSAHQRVPRMTPRVDRLSRTAASSASS
jgi:hypothetical protein